MIDVALAQVVRGRVEDVMTSRHDTCLYTDLLVDVAFAQVVRERVEDVLSELFGKLRIVLEHRRQTAQRDTLQIAVRQTLDVTIRLYCWVIKAQICSKEVAFSYERKQPVSSHTHARGRYNADVIQSMIHFLC